MVTSSIGPKGLVTSANSGRCATSASSRRRRPSSRNCMTPIAVKTLVLEAMRYSVSGVRPARRGEVGEAGRSGPHEAVAADHAHGGARQAFLAHECAGALEQLLGDGRDALVHLGSRGRCKARLDCPSCRTVGQGRAP